MKSKSMSLVEIMIEKLKDLVKSKEVLGLLIKGAVHIAFDKNLVTEPELRLMFDQAVTSYRK
jgi:hypothetical protein